MRIRFAAAKYFRVTIAERDSRREKCGSFKLQCVFLRSFLSYGTNTKKDMVFNMLNNKDFDRFLKREAEKQPQKMPQDCIEKTEELIGRMPVSIRKKRSFGIGKSVLTVTALFLIIFIVLPVVSPSAAAAMETIPGIGRFVHVITSYRYVYDDENHDADVKIPSVQYENDGEKKYDGETSPAANYINNSVEELTSEVLEHFNEAIEKFGDEFHSSLKIDYEILKDSADWFTLRIMIYQGTGSSSTYYKIYHIDKQTDAFVTLGDLFGDSDSALTAIDENIREQMREKMSADTSLSYWIDDENVNIGFSKIDGEHNYYFSDNGNIVILFDKYEAAPGYMGCPEFEIPQSVYTEYLKDEYK